MNRPIFTKRPQLLWFSEVKKEALWICVYFFFLQLCIQPNDYRVESCENVETRKNILYHWSRVERLNLRRDVKADDQWLHPANAWFDFSIRCRRKKYSQSATVRLTFIFFNAHGSWWLYNPLYSITWHIVPRCLPYTDVT